MKSIALIGLVLLDLTETLLRHTDTEVATILSWFVRYIAWKTLEIYLVAFLPRTVRSPFWSRHCVQKKSFGLLLQVVSAKQ